MIVARFCQNGKLKIKRVSSNDKINSLYCHQKEETLSLYGRDIHKVEINMDKASSHTRLS